MNEQGGLLGESALDRPVSRAFRLNWEKALYIVLISLALLTRLWGIGDRVQSHDESLHTKYSWDLYVGNGFRHTPLMHGPFLFHATALSYYIFGDNDTSARVVVALLGVAIVAFPWLLRRWLGRAGALVTSLLLLISPSIAYYSRYIRHDIPVIVWFLIALLGAISYLQEGRERWLAVMAGGVALMFCTKEVSFIYSAILGVFLVLAVLVRAALRADGRTRDVLMAGIVTIGLGLCILGLSLALRPAGETRLAWWGVAGAGLAGAAFSLTVVVAGIASARALAARWRAKRVGWPPAVLGLIVGWVVLGLLLTLLLPLLQAVGSCAGQPDGTASLIGCARASLAGQPPAGRVQVVMLALTLAGVGLLVAVWLLTTALPNERSFDLVIVLGTLCLPFLTPLLVHLAGSDPTDYGQPTITYSGAMLIAVVVLSAAVGLLWDLQRQSLGRRPWVWLTSASIFYAITVVLFTTVFTNGSGIATGFIGSLGYWLAQHDVKRGGQPWYYYLLTVPMYEYLPLMVTLVSSATITLRALLGRSVRAFSRTLFVPFLLWWIALAWIAYSVAGEKMPWLTVHLALPMILFAGWTIGRLLNQLRGWQAHQRWAWLLLIFTPTAVMALAVTIGALSAKPFQASDLAGLDVTGRLLGGLLGLLMFGGATGVLIWRAGRRPALHVLLILGLVLLGALTIRTAWRFLYVNYDYPNELLVYAHAGPAVKQTMAQIEELSRRVTGEPEQLQVAYGADGSWPFHWYLRNYSNAIYYGSEPTREAMRAPVIIVGRGEWEKVTPYIGDEYLVNTYTYLWWPAEDYRNLTLERVMRVFTEAGMARAIWDIWYDRDYTRYDELTGKVHTIDAWPLRNEYRLYIRRDLAAQIWDLRPTAP